MKFWPLVREIGVLRLIWMFQCWTLNIVLYDKLTFSDYFTHNIQKALGRLSGLNRFKSLQAFILSIFEYCYSAHRSSISRNYTGNPKIADHLHRLMFKLRRYNWVLSLWEEAHLLQMEAIYFVIYSPQGPCPKDSLNTVVRGFNSRRKVPSRAMLVKTVVSFSQGHPYHWRRSLFLLFQS